MKRLISFSLWGSSKLYCQGAVDNVALAHRWYPGWTPRFYVARDCPALSTLQRMDCEVVTMDLDLRGVDRQHPRWVDLPANVAMMWRFLAAEDSDASHVIFRDTDSYLNPREAAAVSAWVDSGEACHNMKEVGAHMNAPLYGGMFGLNLTHMVTKAVVGIGVQPQINLFVNSFKRIYGKEPWIFSDLIFLRDYWWDKLSCSCLWHGYHGQPFPEHSPLEDGVSFVGQSMNPDWRYLEFGQ